MTRLIHAESATTNNYTAPAGVATGYFSVPHGKQDRILPIEKCGRRIAADLNGRAYGVTLTEFDGGHEIPADVLREGFRWLGSL
jgi:phospholipase/carboxylesterase